MGITNEGWSKRIIHISDMDTVQCPTYHENISVELVTTYPSVWVHCADCNTIFRATLKEWIEGYFWYWRCEQ